jgi:hypothetical protein
MDNHEIATIVLMNHETTTYHAMHDGCVKWETKRSESGDFGSGCGTTKQKNEGLRRN